MPCDKTLFVTYGDNFPKPDLLLSVHYIEEKWLLIKVKDLVKDCQDTRFVSSKHSQ